MKPGRRSKVADASKYGDAGYGKISSSVKVSTLKEFARGFIDCNEFISLVQNWLQEKLEKSEVNEHFKQPFQLEELRQLDYALEGVLFQQLVRMPCPQPYSTPDFESETCFAVEDFLHTVTQALWDTFWSSEDRMPFFVIGPRGSSSKLKKGGVHGVALVGKNGRGGTAQWEHIAEFVEVEPEIGGGSDGEDSSAVCATVGRALFHGLHMLMSRVYSDKKPAIRRNVDTAYMLFVDSSHGGVVKLKGDVMKIDTKAGLCYESAADWIRKHAEVSISSVEQVWNRFGNANWGDLGALQLILATFNCLEQCKGSPKKAIAELAADHNARLHRRKIERRFLEIQENGSDQYVHHQQGHGEIVEIEEVDDHVVSKEIEQLKLEPGTVLWLEDAQWQRGFQIISPLGDGKCSVYSATSLDELGKPLAVYVGAHPSQLEPSWEDMSTWYQVQRQTRVLNIMKQRGISSKYLPQLIASGRLLHPGSCTRQSPGGRCDHPWCGIPVLVTSPVGDSLDTVIAKNGTLSCEESLRCCYDMLSALRSAGSAGIQHGDLSPEHVVRVKGADGDYYYVLIDWGRAILEERDSPAIAPRYSSTYALQEGKLCPASDAESLVYLLYFLSGGTMPDFDSMEVALQWRERAWAIRTFQLHLGEVSTVLKAFADYVDSLIGTPYPVDYDIWLRRLTRALHSEDPGKRIEYLESSGKAAEYAESSGTSGTS